MKLTVLEHENNMHRPHPPIPNAAKKTTCIKTFLKCQVSSPPCKVLINSTRSAFIKKPYKRCI